MAKLKDYLSYEQPTKYIVDDDNYCDDYSIPVLTAGQSFILGYTDETEGIFDASNTPVIIFDDFTTSIQYVDFSFKVKSSALKILIPKSNADIKYWYYYLKNVDIDSTVHKRYWISEFSEMDVIEKTLEEQQEISKKLDSIQEAIDNRKKLMESLDLYVNSKYNELFKNDVTEWTKIGDEFEVITGGTPSKKVNEYWNGGTISWIGSSMCNDSIIYHNDGKYITEAGYKHSNAKLFPVDTVCIALVGATLGKTALLKFETTTNQNIAGILVTKNESFIPEFVFYSLKMNYYIFESMGKGFNMANLKDIRELPIPKSSKDEQLKFWKIVFEIENMKKSLDKEIKDLDQLIKSKINEFYN